MDCHCLHISNITNILFHHRRRDQHVRQGFFYLVDHTSYLLYRRSLSFLTMQSCNKRASFFRKYHIKNIAGNLKRNLCFRVIRDHVIRNFPFYPFQALGIFSLNIDHAFRRSDLFGMWHQKLLNTHHRGCLQNKTIYLCQQSINTQIIFFQRNTAIPINCQNRIVMRYTRQATLLHHLINEISKRNK